MIVRICDGYIAVLEERKPAGMPIRWFGELRTDLDEPIKERIVTARKGYPISQAPTKVEVIALLTERAEQLTAVEEAVAQ